MIRGSRLKYIFLTGCIICSTPGFAQEDVSALIKSGPADASKLADAYLTPLFKGFGIGLNSGWNNSAHAKKLGRFEVRFGLTGAIIPESDKTFDVSGLGLSDNIRPVDPSQTIAPTVGGTKDSGPVLAIYDDSNREVERFTLPGGADVSFIPAPQIQGSIGLLRGIEVTLRGFPNVNLGRERGILGMFGGGIKIELLPLFVSNTADRFIPIDIAVAVGYTRFNYKLPLNVEPPSGGSPDPNQMIHTMLSGINAEAIISKKLLFFTPYASVGYNTARTNARLKGEYEFTTGGTLLGPTYTTFEDPITIKRNDISGLRANIGFQLNLAALRIFASYSMAEYNALNAGIGVGIGK